jgi:hypothetical protein
MPESLSAAAHSIEARKHRWREFLAPGAPAGFMFFIRFRDPDVEHPACPPRWPDKVAERIEFAWRSYEIARAQAEWLHDDFVPYFDNLTGTEIFAEPFGCPVYRPDDTMPFARPCVFSAAEADRCVAPPLEDTSLMYLFDIADELARRGGRDAVQRLVDIQSPMGVVAEIWDKADLFCALIESPEAVKALAPRVKALLVAFQDEWFRRYGRAFVAHCPDYFMDGGITLSEDEVGSVSSDLFHEFFLPDLVELSGRYGAIGIHCCAAARHQWENFARVPGLRLINLSQQANQKTDPAYIGDAYRFWAPHAAQMHEPFTPEEHPERLPHMAPGARIVYQVQVETRDQARRWCDLMLEARESFSPPVE